eukprot:COSAG01_NODE_17068_length_1181_cov_1.451941_2_plen_241_part_00
MTVQQQLQACLGGLWPPPCALDAEVAEVNQPAGEPFRRERVSYQSEPGERIPAFLLVPHAACAASPAPAISLCHQHAGQYHLGKSEPVGLAGDPSHHTGVALARQGFVVLCPDALCFEERQTPRQTEEQYATTAPGHVAAAEAELSDEGGLKSGGLKGGDLERFEFLRYVVDGKCLAWKSVLDFRRSVVSAKITQIAAGRRHCAYSFLGSLGFTPGLPGFARRGRLRTHRNLRPQVGEVR